VLRGNGGVVSRSVGGLTSRAADDLLETIRSWGIERGDLVDTSDSEFIPKALKLPFMLGTMGILHGRK